MPAKAAATRTRKQASLSPFPDGTQPTWEIAYLFPAQGTWTEKDYLDLDGVLPEHPRRELSDGRLEVLPWATQTHQLIMVFLFELLEAFTTVHVPGLVLFAGMRVRFKNGHYREPDVLYMKAEHAHRRTEEHWQGAGLLMEVVSGDPKDRERDLVVKRREYAQARIPEYWIIDPEQRRILVLTLKGRTYQVHGDFTAGMQATSVLLPGFAVSVDAVLAPPGSEQPK